MNIIKPSLERLVNEEQIYIRIYNHKNTAPHFHNFLELVYVISGQAIHIRDGKKTVVNPGDYYIIDYNSTHEYITDDENFLIINCLFVPRFIDSSLNGCRSFQKLLNNYLIRLSADFSDINPTQTIFHDDNGRIKSILDILLSEYKEKQPGYLEIMRCGLIEIIIQTVRKTSRRDTDMVYKNYSRYIMKYVSKNYMQPITLSEIAQELNFSIPYLSKVFKEDTGMGFSEYLQKIRIEEACRLLANTDSKVIDIAQSVGYNDICTFNLIFKKHLGITPRDFRKSVKS